MAHRRAIYNPINLHRVVRVLRPMALPLLTMLMAACGGGGIGSDRQDNADVSPAQPAPYVYSIPEQTDDGWITGHFDDHGFDSEIIIELMSGISTGQFTGIDSITIVRNDTLILHSTFQRFLDEFDSWIGNTDPNLHILHSTSKSFTSALIGIAIDQGYISSINTPFYELFSYADYLNPDPRKTALSLEDSLTMRLGFEWDEWSVPYTVPGNDLEDLMRNNSDYAKALLDLPMSSEPGTTFTYNTAATIAIGQALENAVGVPMDEYAELNLFQPLQIQSAIWGRTPTGLPNGGAGLFLEPRDMIKFGQLFLNRGRWKERQILSGDWVTTSVTPHVTLDWPRSSGYGYQWWLGGLTYQDQAIETWSTQGFGGQYIFCIPSLNLVVAFTAHNYDANEALPFTLMQDFVLKSLIN